MVSSENRKAVIACLPEQSLSKGTTYPDEVAEAYVFLIKYTSELHSPESAR